MFLSSKTVERVNWARVSKVYAEEKPQAHFLANDFLTFPIEVGQGGPER